MKLSAPLAAVLLGACTMPTTDTASTIYAEGGEIWTAEAIVDTGTDTGTDTGADTGTDGFDPTTLSAGEVLITFSGDAYGQSFDDQCAGDVALTVTDKAITGTTSCEFQGDLASFITGEQVAEVSGTISDTEASGVLALQIGDQDFSFKWDGSTDGSSIYGAFEGIVPLDAGGFTLELSYAGGFNAAK